MAYALIPRESDGTYSVREAAPLDTTSADEIAAKLTLADGSSDFLVRRPAAGTEAAFGPIRTDAEVALVRLAGDGEATRVLQLGGTEAALR
jgi:hypothetical protein